MLSLGSDLKPKVSGFSGLAFGCGTSILIRYYGTTARRLARDFVFQ